MGDEVELVLGPEQELTKESLGPFASVSELRQFDPSALQVGAGNMEANLSVTELLDLHKTSCR